jgi:hypothetical protein
MTTAVAPNAVVLPSNRSFGWTFTVIFSLAGAYSAWTGGVGFAVWFTLAAVMAALTCFVPDSLAAMNHAWMKFAALLHRVVSPVVLGVMFFGVFTPVGFVMRRFGRDAMKRSFDPEATTYWIERTPPGPAPESLREQF